MANDRYCFLVLEESLSEGTIAEHRRSRLKANRPVATKRQRMLGGRPVIERSARSRKVA
jgi:hypothetical protein